MSASEPAGRSGGGEPTVGGAREAYPVMLTAGDDPSGLADMLHQYLSQTLADSPEKVQRARRLDGEVAFQAAEDEAISVKLVFRGDRIELVDGELVEAPRLTGDFLSVAHLTSGDESPLGLVLSRKLRVKFSVQHLPFLMGVLDLMTLEEELRRRRARLRWVGAGAAAATAASAVGYYLTTLP